MSKTVKGKTAIEVKGIGIWDRDMGFISRIQTYMPHGNWINKRFARREAKNVKDAEHDPGLCLVDCTITFTIPQKGKRK